MLRRLYSGDLAASSEARLEVKSQRVTHLVLSAATADAAAFQSAFVTVQLRSEDEPILVPRVPLDVFVRLSAHALGFDTYGNHDLYTAGGGSGDGQAYFAVPLGNLDLMGADSLDVTIANTGGSAITGLTCYAAARPSDEADNFLVYALRADRNEVYRSTSALYLYDSASALNAQDITCEVRAATDSYLVDSDGLVAASAVFGREEVAEEINLAEVYATSDVPRRVHLTVSGSSTVQVLSIRQEFDAKRVAKAARKRMADVADAQADLETDAPEVARGAIAAGKTYPSVKIKKSLADLHPTQSQTL